MSLLTRVMIDPMVRHATRRSWQVALFDVRTVSQAAIASKSRVWPTPCPGNLRHRRAVQAALDPLSLGFDEHFGGARIQATPPSLAVAAVIAR